MTTHDPKSRVFAQHACLIFGAVITLGFASVLIVGISAHAQRSQQERTSIIPTAVNDSTFLPMPIRIDRNKPLLKWQREPYFPKGDAPDQEDDGVMIRAGTTTDGAMILYRKAGKESEPEMDNSVIYVKVGPGKFLALLSQPGR